MTETTNSLYSAMLAVMGEIGYVQKTGKVQGGGMNYRFAGEAALLKALRPHMVAHGLLLFPVACELREHHEVVETKYGPKPSRTIRTVSTYRLAHVSGEHVDLQVAGEGQDKGDKATAKAMTIALKYALRQAFLIETGDDPDTTRPEADYEPPETARRPKAKDAPLRPAAFGKLSAKLRDTFGESNGRDKAFERADGLAFDIVGKGIGDVMQSAELAGKMLAAMEQGR
jgi:hypothetical protein